MDKMLKELLKNVADGKISLEKALTQIQGNQAIKSMVLNSSDEKALTQIQESQIIRSDILNVSERHEGDGNWQGGSKVNVDGAWSREGWQG